jgi:hypothetical protein
VDDWLKGAADALAAVSGAPRAELELDSDTELKLLELARIAAHESGARTNAPLLCYLVGRAQQRGVSIDALSDAVATS